jgi:paraquat-inducible protein B
MNSLPLRPLISVATGTLKQSQRTMTEIQKSLRHIDGFISSPAMKTLSEDMQQSLQQLSRSIKGIQHGSPVYQKLTGDMQRLDLVLRELQPLLKTLDKKSNALIIQDAATDDPVPVGAKKRNEK